MFKFSRALLAPVVALFALLPVACSAADSAAQYEEGKQYKRVSQASTPDNPARIEVAEFFWYGCGHCYAFEPVVRKWEKTRPADVDFKQVPNSLGRPIGVLHSKAFYTADTLGVMDKAHQPLFDAIQRQPNGSEDQLAATINEATGIMPDVVKGTLNGFAVDSRVRNAEALVKQYSVTSTPTLVIGGVYKVDPGSAGGFEGMLKVTDFLIEKVRKERKAK